MPKKVVLTQFAALPYRVTDGALQVLMVTSRETKRWILPKGQPEKKLKAHEVARSEAFEEAGVKGSIGKSAMAHFDSSKRLKNGREVPAQIHVYLLRVDIELDHWPEQHERERRWFTPAEAAETTGEPGLVPILLSLNTPKS